MCRLAWFVVSLRGDGNNIFPVRNGYIVISRKRLGGYEILNINALLILSVVTVKSLLLAANPGKFLLYLCF